MTKPQFDLVNELLAGASPEGCFVMGIVQARAMSDGLEVDRGLLEDAREAGLALQHTEQLEDWIDFADKLYTSWRGAKTRCN